MQKDTKKAFELVVVVANKRKPHKKLLLAKETKELVSKAMNVTGLSANKIAKAIQVNLTVFHYWKTGQSGIGLKYEQQFESLKQIAAGDFTIKLVPKDEE